MMERPRISLDIWPMIFECLTPSEKSCLVNLTLACSSLRYVAQPFLFRNLTIRPFHTYITFDSQRELRTTLSAAEVEWQLSRLQFVAGPRIAPAVKEIQVIPTETWQRKLPRSNSGDVNVILDALLSALPAFPSLRRVQFHHLIFSSAHMESLSRVERFRNLTIIGGALLSDEPSHPLLTVDRLRITPSLDNEDSSHAWLSAVKLDRVSLLSFWASPRTQSVLTVDRARSMHSLRTLDVNVNRSSTPYLFSVLAALPLLQSLNIPNTTPESDPDSNDQHPSAKVTLANLDRYVGPLSILLRLNLPNLNHLDITCVSDTATPAEPNALIQMLPYIQDTLRTLKNLKFTILFLNEPLCKMILSRLPPDSQIESLQFLIFDPSLSPADHVFPFVDSLEATCQAMMESDMPRNIQKIHILFYVLQDPRQAPVLDYVTIKDDLVKKCSRLRCLWLQRPSDVFFWSRNAMGRESVSRAQDPDYTRLFNEV